MVRLMKSALPVLWLMLASMLMFSWSGCGSDLYSPCELDPNSADANVRRCADGESGQSRTSCLIKNQIQCDTRVCGRYLGSDPFCTVRCQSDEDCPAGGCREFVFQSGEKYCVESVDMM